MPHTAQPALKPQNTFMTNTSEAAGERSSSSETELEMGSPPKSPAPSSFDFVASAPARVTPILTRAALLVAEEADWFAREPRAPAALRRRGSRDTLRVPLVAKRPPRSNLAPLPRRPSQQALHARG